MGVIRTPFCSGTVLNNPLAVGDTSLSSTGLSSLATIASPDIAKIILDPQGSAGAPEVVYVTAHSASATTATVTRACEGTTARQHSAGIPWVVGPTSLDFGWTSTPATGTVYNPLDPWWEVALASYGTTISAATGSANQAYGIPMRPLQSDATLATLSVYVNTQAGNIDLGIYQWDGTTMTKIVTLGSTACPAAGQYNANITDTVVYKGVRYYFWFASDSAATSMFRVSALQAPNPTAFGANVFPSKTATFPLPSTITSLSAAVGAVVTYGNFA